MKLDQGSAPFAAVELGGHIVKVDPERADSLTDELWGVYRVKRNFYVMGKKAGKTTYLHRQIAGAKDGEIVVFDNRDTLDLRRHNLIVTRQRIEATRTGPRSNNKSGYKGVSWAKRRKQWEAKFSQTVRGARQHEHLGYYDAPEDAARAYDRRLIEAHGKGAVTNERLGLL